MLGGVATVVGATPAGGVVVGSGDGIAEGTLASVEAGVEAGLDVADADIDASRTFEAESLGSAEGALDGEPSSRDMPRPASSEPPSLGDFGE
ncbi:MAG: hypothetical protein JWN48_2888 [Myxococcaceae bacterium]|nr:hypothetical protein [Myxococcaceae bacterium]